MSEKRKYNRFLILCLLYFFMISAWGQKVNTVVLDAGHGGHDTGALGRNSREKDITLAIVLKLRDLIHEKMPDMKVILTRDDDNFVELFRRAHIANENKADLFISVHCNSTRGSSASGVETFVMGLHKSEANLAVAKAENAAILLEDNYVEEYDGFDPNSPEGNIFFSMMQNAFLDRSLAFAGDVQHEMIDNLHMINRGLKQAGFLVLYKTAMPGVLVETGFISNSRDEKFLMSEKGQLQLAKSIFNALCTYKNQIDKRIPLHQYAYSLESVLDKPDEGKATDETVENYPVDKEKVNSDQGILSFRVQYATFPKPQPKKSSIFKGMHDVKVYRQSGMYKYTAGDYNNFEDADRLRKILSARGYKDAFVVVFRGEQRVSKEEAKRLTGKK